MKKEMILAITALVIAIAALIITVASLETRTTGPQGPEGPPGTFEGEWHDLKRWSGEGDFTSSDFHVDGYVMRIDWYASASIHADHPSFILQILSPSGIAYGRKSVYQYDFEGQYSQSGIYYIFVEPGDYRLDVIATGMDRWNVDIDAFY